jgi:ferredoxin--NADP+ reductase
VSDLVKHHVVISQSDWEKINAVEVAAGEPLGKPRVKAVFREDLLKHAGF